MFAVVEIAGKQYKVSPQSKIAVDLLCDQKVGDEINIDKVLLTSEEDGANFTVGQPYTGTSIKAKIIEEIKGDKAITVKFIAKKRHNTTQGHRQKYTVLEIGSF